MMRGRVLMGLGVLVVASLSWAQDAPAEGAAPAAQPAPAAAAAAGDAELRQALDAGRDLLQARKPAEAIPHLDRAIAGFRRKHAGMLTFAARTPAETLAYLTQASGERKKARVVGSDWGYAHFMKAYALIELKRLAEAKRELNAALTLSPQNSHFLSEMGHIHQVERNWETSLQFFRRAEEAAKSFSPPATRNSELTRAMRGVAYVRIEQGRLDDAEAIYRECLRINPDDRIAANQIEYIRMQRTRKPGAQ